MAEGQKSLAEYARTGSETAFREVVAAYLDLVYSTAVRLVEGDAHLAQDVTQNVFADLAKMAGSLSREVMVGGWLHRHTCFLARKTMRSERRRRAREQKAVEMNTTEDHSADNLQALTPALDEAINQLGAQDRQAIVLRYFEQRDLRSVGAVLGSNEDAARKRVNRALEKLRSLLKRRGITLSAAALGSALGVQAVSAAPIGLAGTVTASALATVAAGGGTTLTILHLMTMTKVQVGAVAVITLALAIPLVVQHRTQTQLREENALLRAQVQRLQSVATENSRLAGLANRPPPAVSPTNSEQLSELMKLRGEVGTLRKTASEPRAAATPSDASPLSGITTNAEMSKLIRDQQKFGLGMIYKDFGKRANLPKEKQDELNNLLADHVMTNINHITAVLREGRSPEQMESVFAQQDAETNEKVKALIGPEAYAQYQEYNRNLASHITTEQFKGKLSGDAAAKDAATQKLYQLMQQQTQRTLAERGLSEDYQLVPTLNFRNFASEQEADRNLQLLDSIYEHVQSESAAFLSPEEVQKFAEFRKLAINNNRIALVMNRKLMAPPTK